MQGAPSTTGRQVTDDGLGRFAGLHHRAGKDAGSILDWTRAPIDTNPERDTRQPLVLDTTKCSSRMPKPSRSTIGPSNFYEERALDRTSTKTVHSHSYTLDPHSGTIPAVKLDQRLGRMKTTGHPRSVKKPVQRRPTIVNPKPVSILQASLRNPTGAHDRCGRNTRSDACTTMLGNSGPEISETLLCPWPRPFQRPLIRARNLPF